MSVHGFYELRLANSIASSKKSASLVAANHLPSFSGWLATRSRKMVSRGICGYFFTMALNVAKLVVVYVAPTA